jgi:hypothetical protein
MAFDVYDIQAAAAGGASQRSPEERQMAQTRRLIRAAEGTNYDGDPEYYQQIKAIALQAGIPIKSFKTNPFRLAKTGALSMLDTALFGFLPNELYTPMNEAEKTAATVGAGAGMFLPWGGPARAFQAGKAVLGGQKFMQSGTAKKAWDAFLRRNPKAAQTLQGKGNMNQFPAGQAPGMGASINATNKPIYVGRQGTGQAPLKIMPGQKIPEGAKIVKSPVIKKQAANVGGKPPKSADTSPPPKIELKTDGEPNKKSMDAIKRWLKNQEKKVKKGPKAGAATPKAAGAAQGAAKIKLVKSRRTGAGTPSASGVAKIKALMTKAQRDALNKIKDPIKRETFLMEWMTKNQSKIFTSYS